MSSQRYERVSATDENDAASPITPISPPPSFRSRASSPSMRHQQHDNSLVDSTLADTFDADDSDEDNDGDDRQRLMRGTPTTSSSLSASEHRINTPDTLSSTTTSAQNGRPAAVLETRATHIQAFAPPSTRPNGPVYGGGSGSDGVFANLSAKPESGEKVEEHPPTYEQAAADAAPPYWETTILAPGLGGPDDVYIDGLPVGSVFSFAWNGMISMSFQLVGFLLTYLLHTTHAAKNGSRAGLGITLVQYGFYMKGSSPSGTPKSGNSAGDPEYSPPDPNSHSFSPEQIAANAAAEAASHPHASSGNFLTHMAGSEWLAYALMIVGWFILIRAVSDFLKARRHEQLVLQSPERGLGVPVVAPGEEAETVV